MLTVERLRAGLPVDGLGDPLYFFTSIGSTSQYARELAEQNAPHGTLVVADEQTAGRGRGANHWSTPPQSAVAFSIVLRPDHLAAQDMGGLNALGALAVGEALEALGAKPRIKWPNDILLKKAKVAGILTEVVWQGDKLEYALVGMGVNVRPKSVPNSREVSFPATCVETATGLVVDRSHLLLAIVGGLATWYQRLGTEDLVEAWEKRLAYRGQWVGVRMHSGERQGVVRGLTREGWLKLETSDGEPIEVGAEGAVLRPIDRPDG
jgi:BirA family transcriptional regulator, biotin operon repressor / biotin---[acetyl-CoA-carboxylase] ligase